MSQSARWCFTLNNYTDADVAKVDSIPEVVYIVAGKEVGNSGTPHLQGFVVFVSKRRLRTVQQVFERAHWEVTRGTSEQAADYCKKDGDYMERGNCPRTAAAAGGDAEAARWKRARESAEKGDLSEVPDDIYVRYYRTLKDIKKDHMDKPADADGVTGVWIWGPAGVGKSRSAREQFPDAYFKMQNKWWDGYQGEENVILDDLDSKEMGHLIKIWSDRYSFLAETKGGAIHIRPKKIIITSNYSIEQLWINVDPEMAHAISRRFVVQHMTASPTV